MGFSSVYQGMQPDEKRRVAAWLQACASDGADGRAVSDNFQQEESFKEVADHRDFILAHEPVIPGGTTVGTEYERICRLYKLNGRPARVDSAATLYRTIDGYSFAKSVCDATGKDFDANNLRGLLGPYIRNREERMRDGRRLHLARPDREICWSAFFHSHEPDFFGRGWSAEVIFLALGIEHTQGKEFIIGCFSFLYPVSALSSGEEPRIPTVSDAGFNRHFKPASLGALWGETAPLSRQGAPIKEIVHKNRLADIVVEIEYRDL